MSQDSKRFSVMIGLVGLFALLVMGGVWLFVSYLNRITQDDPVERRTPPPVRENRPRVVKIYGPIVRATPRPKPKARKKVQEEPKRYVPPRYRIVFRQAPPQVPPGAPTFPPLTNKEFYTLSREKLKQWAHLPIEQMGARFTPAFKWGNLNGIRVDGLDDHSYYRRMGLYREDVIMKINGRQVVAPGQARKFFQTIASRYRNITIQFRRGGKVRTVDFSLK